MVALSKDSGGVRGIVAGDAFRRMVGKTLAKQFAKDFDQATAPFQYALFSATSQTQYSALHDLQ
jgi:hypothetical protein